MTGIRKEDIRALADMVGTPEAAEAVYRMMDEPGGRLVEDSAVVADLIADLDQLPDGEPCPNWKAIRAELVDLGNQHNPNFWGLLRQSENLAGIVLRDTSLSGSSKHSQGEPKVPRCKPQVIDAPRWKALATEHAPLLKLNKAAVDVLNLVERVVVFNKGWGLSDREAGMRLAIPLDPVKISKRGPKIPANSIKKVIPRLIRLGLLHNVGKDPSGHRLVVPAWDPRVCSDPAWVFSGAASRERSGKDQAKYWQRIGNEMAKDPVRTINEEIASIVRNYNKKEFANEAD